MEKLKTVGISIGDETLDRLDEWVAERNVDSTIDTKLNRSSAIRMAVREMLADAETSGE